MRNFADRFTWLIYALIAVGVILILSGIFVQAAEAEDADTRTVLCAMVSRELTRIEIETGSRFTPVLVGETLNYVQEHDDKLRDATAEVATSLYLDHYRHCETQIDVLPSLPKIPASELEPWARSIAMHASRFDGIVPAADRPAPKRGSDSWRAQCAAEYVSWNPDDETVIRRGSPNRVPCPCGKEVECQ